MEVLRRMTRKKTPKEKESMPSVAKKLVMLHFDERGAGQQAGLDGFQ